MQELEFAARIHQNGGRVFIVGGWVRDSLLGRVPKDKDYVVCGIGESRFQELFPALQKVGHSFPVYLLRIEGVLSEVALARREKKNGRGYTGFCVEYDEGVPIEEDLYRRDTTMNSMAMELPEMSLLDPFHGQRDIADRKIRACSHHFLEDPVRALRASRQSAELGFSITADTLQLMSACRNELREEPAERILQEMTRALESDMPSRFFRSLQEASLLEAVFPEIHALIGKTQPKEFHPEGDAFEHTMHMLDEAAKATCTVSVRFAALAHDLGKGTTPKEMEPHHYGHEIRGLDVLEGWNQRCVLPREWLEAARFVIREHMRAPLLKKPGKIVALLLALKRQKMSLEDFNHIILSDHGSLPRYLEYGEAILKKILLVSGRDCPPEIYGADIGKWVFEQQVRVYMNEKV